MVQMKTLFLFALIFYIILFVNAKEGGDGDPKAQHHDTGDSGGNADAAPAPKRSQTGHDKNGKVVHSRSGRRRRRRPRLWIPLRTAPECLADIQRLCPKSQRVDNFVIIDCLQHDTKTADSVSENCQHLIWQFKRNITRSRVFESASNHICDSDFKKIKACSGVPEGSQKVACMFEYKQQIETPECLVFLNKVGTLLFSDYHLVYKFEKKCGADIMRLKCGRLAESASAGSSDEKSDLPSSQGRTIECLMNSQDKLQQDCNREIMRVAELQSDDFHLDRPLYFACREDREKFCEKTHAGEGRVYKCLIAKMQDDTMSGACRKELTHRLRLRAKDYKVDYSFAGICAKDVAAHKCASEEHSKMMKKGIMAATVSISDIVLCLEGVMKEQKVVTSECQSEMLTVRQQMMSDYQITPEIVLHCAVPIKEFCKNGLQRNGRTLHCLMDRLKGKMGQPELKNFPKCVEALHFVVKVADAGSDYRVDPVIQHNCRSDIVTFCNDVAGTSHGDGAIYSCLLSNMDSKKMSSSCGESLLELQYVVSRDFSLDPQLYEKCKKDAVSICHAPSVEWHTKAHGSTGGIIFSCLVNQLQLKEESLEDEEDEDDDETKRTSNQAPPTQQISKGCGDEVLRVLRDRSSQLMLNPYIYDHCLSDLASKCSSVEMGKNEMDCLINKIDDLKEECAKVVRNFAAEQDRNPSLDRILSRACAPMIQQFCTAEMKSDSALIMPCMIRHKNHDNMDPKCRAGIEHHQIISLKDFHISTAFRRGCAKDLRQRCPQIKTKSEAVICLSELVRNATLLGKEVKLSRACKQQIRFENLAKSQDIRLSPRIHHQCKDDVYQFCRHVPVSRQIKCLRSMKWSDLSKGCRKAIFDRTQMESFDSRIDARLQRVCKPMIQHYCRSQRIQALDCLWKHIHDENFDQKCRRVVYLRLETRIKDYRLDPLLNQLCKRDMRRHCVAFMDPKRNMTGTQYRSQMLTCLKKRFKDYDLSSNCQGYMRQLIVEVNMNHHMDPVLRAACAKDVQHLCGHELEDADGREGDGRVTECLKKNLQLNRVKSSGCRKEVLRLMDESRADVHVDPVLYEACNNELNTICRHVQLGNGRQMSCLLWAKDDKEATKGMSFTCRKRIQERQNMWEMAARVASPNTLKELAVQVTTSDSRHFFFAFFTFIVLGIFIFGMCCGCATKRVRVDAKNK